MPVPSWPSTTGVGNGMVPSITDTSLWQTPAAWRSTRTSSARTSRTVRSAATAQAALVEHDPSHGNAPGRCNVRSSRTTRWTAARCRRGSRSARRSRPTPLILNPPKGSSSYCCTVLMPTVAGAQLLGHVVGPGGVGREDVVEQPELGGVGQRHGFVVVVEGDDHDDRPEDLLLGHLHVDAAVGQQRRGHEEAALEVGAARRRPRPRRPASRPACDVALDPRRGAGR